MHNYSVQNRFTTKTKLGNWYQESELSDFQFKEYLYKKDNNENVTLRQASQLQLAQQPVQVSGEGEWVCGGDVVQLGSMATRAVLAYNTNDRILSEQTYAVTASPVDQPFLRNTFRVEAEGVVRYGDEVRFNTNGLYLQSVAVSPMRSSKMSRNQEVSVTVNRNSNGLWVVDHIDARVRFSAVGQPVPCNATVLVRHCMTAQWLAAHELPYVNEFGKEWQVFAKSILATSKTQNLFAERQGKKSVENPLRSQGVQNEWRILKNRL